MTRAEKTVPWDCMLCLLLIKCGEAYGLKVVHPFSFYPKFIFKREKPVSSLSIYNAPKSTEYWPRRSLTSHRKGILLIQSQKKDGDVVRRRHNLSRQRSWRSLIPWLCKCRIIQVYTIIVKQTPDWWGQPAQEKVQWVIPVIHWTQLNLDPVY